MSENTEIAIRDMDLVAQRVAESKLFGLDKAQAFTLMLLAQAEGLPMISAIRRFHIIEGKPSMRADAMQAEFQRHGGVLRWVVTTDAEVQAEFSHPSHQPQPITVHITLKDMIDKGIAQGFKGMKDNWRKFPRQMLRARAISEGVRMVDPGIVVGIYTPEEVQDFAPSIDVLPPVPEHHAVHHNNDTGHGSGAYAEPDDVKAYQGFIESEVVDVNQRWCDRLTNPPDGEVLTEADGEITNTWELSGHLLKWSKAQGWVNAPAEIRAGQRDKFCAVAWKDHMNEFMEEARDYFKKKWNEKLRAAKAKAGKVARAQGKREAPEVLTLAEENEAMDALLTTEAGARG
jgi:hypothetical protein